VEAEAGLALMLILPLEAVVQRVTLKEQTLEETLQQPEDH
jgi:hypothetical protein